MSSLVNRFRYFNKSFWLLQIFILILAGSVTSYAYVSTKQTLNVRVTDELNHRSSVVAESIEDSLKTNIDVLKTVQNIINAQNGLGGALDPYIKNEIITRGEIKSIVLLENMDNKISLYTNIHMIHGDILSPSQVQAILDSNNLDKTLITALPVVNVIKYSSNDSLIALIVSLDKSNSDLDSHDVLIMFISTSELINNALRRSLSPGLTKLHLYEFRDASSQQLIYSNNFMKAQPNKQINFSRNFVSGGRHFRLDTAYTSEHILNNNEQYFPFIVLIIGVLLTLLIMSLLFIANDAERKATMRAELATSDIIKFKMAIENANDHIVITDADGVILYANQGVSLLTGYSTSEVIGKKAGSKSLWGGLMPSVIYKEMWETIKIKKQNYTGVIQNKRKSGELYFAQANISPVVENGVVKYFIGIERDVTREKEVEKLEKELSTFFNLSINLLAIASSDGYFKRVSPSFTTLLGWTQAELLKTPLMDFIYPDDRQKTMESIGMLLEKKSLTNFKTRMRRKDGGFTWLMWFARATDQGLMYAIATDIAKEQEIDRMKTEFLSLASHQLRTPLSSMKWSLEMLKNGDYGKVTGDQKEVMQRVYESNEHMIELVDSLLDVSRIESGRLVLDIKVTDLRAVVKDLLKELEQSYVTKKLNVNLEIDANVSPIRTDARLIRNVYLNFLTNAIKYTPDGGNITIKIYNDDINVHSRISDNGYGIPEDQKKYLFTRFFRASNAGGVDPNGSGLGLYAAKEIIGTLGGTVGFESQINKGTTFWFNLPRK